MKTLIVLLAAVALCGCRITRHQSDTSLASLQGLGVAYSRERTNDSTFFSIGLFNKASGRRTAQPNTIQRFELLTPSASRQNIDRNPLNIHPKTP